ncbi:MAG: hypothetical protein FJX62_14910 [Alphaproteobacteria bacterium]|nr:hypothetical protein [Alphaproteobacteria bacterium]
MRISAAGFLSKGARAAAWLIAAWAFAVPAAAQPIESAGLSLLFGWRFQGGDNRAWADPRHDDRAWAAVDVPGLWSAQGLSASRGYAWYRVRFRVRDEWRAVPLAVSLGRIVNADEVYLNGVRIGGYGIAADGFYDARNKARAYRLPASALDPAGENVLAVRVVNFSFKGGFAAGPVGIGRAADVEVGARAVDQVFRGSLTVQVAVMAAAALILLGLWLSNRAATELAYFGASIGLWGVLAMADSAALFGVGEPLLMRGLYAGFSAMVWLWLRFADALAPPPQWERHIGNAYLALVPVYLVLPVERYLVWVDPVSQALLAFALLLVARRTWQAFRSRARHAAILAATVLFVLGQFAFSELPIRLPPEFNPAALMMVVLVTIMAMLVYRQFTRRLAEQNERLATLQEAERRRIGRELHDDVTQQLAAIKLRLGTLDRANLDADLRDAVAAADGAIASVRALARELTPTLGPPRPFSQLLGDYVLSASRNGGPGIAMSVAPDADAALSGERAVHLFRIAQEAIGNALRHAGPRRIDVTLANGAGGLMLTVADDGAGFAAGDAGSGLGVWTMRERAALLGGRCDIDSAPGRGTTVRVRVPVRAG